MLFPKKWEFAGFTGLLSSKNRLPKQAEFGIFKERYLNTDPLESAADELYTQICGRPKPVMAQGARLSQSRLKLEQPIPRRVKTVEKFLFRYSYSLSHSYGEKQAKHEKETTSSDEDLSL